MRQAVDVLILSSGLALTHGVRTTPNKNPAHEIVYYDHNHRATLSSAERLILATHFEYSVEPSMSSIGLAEWIFDNADEVKGKVVIDLATGSGFPAIAAKQAGARQVTAVDMKGEALIRRNAQANKTRSRIVGDNIFFTTGQAAYRTSRRHFALQFFCSFTTWRMHGHSEYIVRSRPCGHDNFVGGKYLGFRSWLA